jgi:hypothetical protein
MRYGCLKITRCSEDKIRTWKQGSTCDKNSKIWVYQRLPKIANNPNLVAQNFRGYLHTFIFWEIDFSNYVKNYRVWSKKHKDFWGLSKDVFTLSNLALLVIWKLLAWPWVEIRNCFNNWPLMLQSQSSNNALICNRY